METKISMKTIYLLSIISVGLITLALGSTFAVFTASAEIDNPISFKSNLSYTDNLFQTIDITIPAKSSEDVNFAVWNNQEINEEINYVTWYIYDGNADDISFKINNSEATASEPSGTLSKEGNNIFITITNNTSNTITLTMGVATNTVEIVLPSYMKILSNDSTPINYSLTINKGTGIETIYYKINDTADYKSSTSNVTLEVSPGTKYYYYGVPQTGYTINTCTEKEPCIETTISQNTSVTINAIKNDTDTPASYTIKIFRTLGEANISTLLMSKSVEQSENVTYTFDKTVTHTSGDEYEYSSFNCTNGQAATIQEPQTQTQRSLLISNITANTECTLYYIKSDN